MKICVIAPCNVLSFSSGASNRVFNIASGLNSCGASVYVLHHGLTKSFNSDFIFINLKSYGFAAGSDNYMHPLNLYFPFKLRKVLRKFNPDIIQCEQPWSAFPTLLIAKHFGVPCVLDEHNVESVWSKHSSRVPFLLPYTSALEGFACTFASLILTTSKDDKEKIIQIYNVPERRISVIPNGVNTQRFSEISLSKAELKNKLNLNPSKKVVLFHGTMSAKQNYEAAQLIFDIIAPKIDNALFLIVGKGSPSWLVARAKMQRNVQILGYVPNIEEYILASDLCIAPIRRGSGTRLKVVEYLAAGKPIISTKIGAEGLPLKSGVHALLFHDVNTDFVASVRRVLEDAEEARELSIKSKELAEQLDWKNIARSLYNLYLHNFGE